METFIFDDFAYMFQREQGDETIKNRMQDYFDFINKKKEEHKSKIKIISDIPKQVSVYDTMETETIEFEMV